MSKLLTNENDLVVICLAHDKGGVGKTTTMINIAVELNKEYKTTCIDLDPKKQFSVFNNRREQKDKINTIVVKNSKELIENLKAMNGLVLIDLGGFDSDLLRYTLLLSDIAIVPLSNSGNDIEGLRDFRKIIDPVVEQRKKGNQLDITFLLNRIHHANKSAHKRLSSYAEKNGFNIFDTVITDLTIYGDMIFGKSATELTSGTAAIRVQRLVEEIKEKIGKING